MNRALPAAVALVITLVAFGSAFGVNTAIAVFVAPEEGAVRAMPAEVADNRVAAVGNVPPPARVRSESEYLHEILKRNVFDMAFIESYTPKKAGGGAVEVRTDLRVKLLGTVVATPAQYSSALIAEDGTDRAHGYGVGDRIHDAEIVEIGQKVVTLKRGDGRVERLTMDEDGDERRPTTTARSTESSGEGGVEQLSENSYVVDRSLIDKYLQDIEGISRLGRALLHRGPDGEFDGYRLSAIRRGTIADQLGIKNGDVIHSVNGQPLNSVQGAMNAYQNLMNESSFSFEVTRRGQKMKMEYQIR